MSTIKVTNVQNPSAASAAITLDTNGQATLNGLAYPTSGSLSGRSRIINGSMMIDQRNAGASFTATTANSLTLDRWKAMSAQASKYSVQQNAGSVAGPAGFPNYLGVTSLAATTPGASDFYWISQTIEAFNTADLNWGSANAQTVTLSFWVRSSLTGTFGGGLTNSDGAAVASTRCYPFTFTISAANTWEYKTITVAGDTVNAWQGATNGIGIAVNFTLGAGSNVTATAGSWTGTSNKYVASGTVNVVGTNGATFYITGVQLEAGSVATPFERRSYGQELALCQRYFETVSGYARASNQGFSWPWAVRKRSDPTLGTPGFSSGSGATFATLPTSGQASGGNPQGTWGFVQNTGNSADSYFVMTSSAEL